MPSFKGSIRPLVFWPSFILLITAPLSPLRKTRIGGDADQVAHRLGGGVSGFQR